MAFTTLAVPTANASLPPGIDPPLRQTGNTVLAIDLGTTVGWALRMGDSTILSGTQTFRPGRFEGGGMRAAYTSAVELVAAGMGDPTVLRVYVDAQRPSDWHKAVGSGEDARAVTRRQIAAYAALSGAGITRAA